MITRKVIGNAAMIGQQWAGIPGVEVMPGGRVYAVWFSGGDKEPSPENTVYLIMSDDGAKSFSKPVVRAGPQNGARAYDPTLWLAPNGVLWLIFNRSNKEAAKHGVFARLCQKPDSADPVWGEEFRVGFEAPYSFRMNKPTVLSTGEWLMPVTHLPNKLHDWFGVNSLQGVARSLDEGRNWSLCGSILAPHWALEGMIMERKDGSVILYIRTGTGTIWQSRSFDRGLTWSEGESTSIPNPGSRFYIRKLPGGDWLLINSPDPTRRTGMVASLSSDEGLTWRGNLVLDDRDNVSYPDAAWDSHGTIYAVHDRDRGGVGEILLSVFTKNMIQ